VPELSTFASPIASINRWREMAYEWKLETQTGPRRARIAPRAGLVSRTIRATSTLGDHHEDVEIPVPCASEQSGCRRSVGEAVTPSMGTVTDPPPYTPDTNRGAEDILDVPDLELLTRRSARWTDQPGLKADAPSCTR